MEGEHNDEVEVNEEAQGSNLDWTAVQTKVVMTGVLNETSPTVIRKILKERFPKGKLPSAIQIANKIAHNQKQVSATKQVLTTGDLRKLISENSQIDYNDESKSYAGKNLVIDGTFCTILFNTVQEGNFLHLHIRGDWISQTGCFFGKLPNGL